MMRQGANMARLCAILDEHDLDYYLYLGSGHQCHNKPPNDLFLKPNQITKPQSHATVIMLFTGSATGWVMQP